MYRQVVKILTELLRTLFVSRVAGYAQIKSEYAWTANWVRKCNVIRENV